MRITIGLAGLLALGALLAAPPAQAHCDGLDGPVVGAARQALAASDVSPALAWVQPKDAPAIRAAFEQVVAVRKLSPAARELADQHFFETLVRVHRAGEGAPYTGLKPAGRDLGPALPAADKALETGDVKPVLQLIDRAVAEGLREKHRRARALAGYAKGDVEAGRKFVEAYVAYVHAVERIYDAAARPAPSHGAAEGSHAAHAEESAAAAAHEH